MAKRPLKIKVRIPPYRGPRNAWRRRLHAIVHQGQKKSGVRYDRKDRLEVAVRLYMNRTELSLHDVDNRLKDILDALQGRAGGPKKIRKLARIIPNDSQIYRVIVEKGNPPHQSHGAGHLVIRRLSTSKRIPRRLTRAWS